LRRLRVECCEAPHGSPCYCCYSLDLRYSVSAELIDAEKHFENLGGPRCDCAVRLRDESGNIERTVIIELKAISRKTIERVLEEVKSSEDVKKRLLDVVFKNKEMGVVAKFKNCREALDLEDSEYVLAIPRSSYELERELYYKLGGALTEVVPLDMTSLAQFEDPSLFEVDDLKIEIKPCYAKALSS